MSQNTAPSTDPKNQPHADRCPSRWWVPSLVASSIFIGSGYPFILTGFVRGRGAHDQLNYHEQVIRTFAKAWPHLDYSDYLSATTPGYHTLLAGFAHLGLDGRSMLQILGSVFTFGLLWVLAWGFRPMLRRVGCTQGLLLGSVLLLLVIASMPIFYSGVWLLPDNAGWLGVVILWLLALDRRWNGWLLGASSIAMATLVFVRQIHLWPLALLLTAAWLGPVRGSASDAHTNEEKNGHGRFGEPCFDCALEWRALSSALPERFGRVGLTLLAAVPALLVLGYFVRLWHGLTPPVFTQRHVGLNASAPAFVLAVFGYCSIFFVPFTWRAFGVLWHRHRWLLGMFVALGFFAAVLPATGYDQATGRFSGLWNLVRRLPMVGHTSPLIVFLSVLGSAMLAGWFVALTHRDRWIMLAGFVAFTAAQCASFKLWQRYTEPFVLIWLVLAATRILPGRSGSEQGWRIIGPLALTLILVAQTSASLVYARPVKVRALVAPWETHAPKLPGMIDRTPEEP